jgi:hypothetical protein
MFSIHAASTHRRAGAAQNYALKRIFVERGVELGRSFAREAHFGEMFRTATSRHHDLLDGRPSQVAPWCWPKPLPCPTRHLGNKWIAN